jgi:molybdopterin converting factor small subunit
MIVKFSAPFFEQLGVKKDTIKLEEEVSLHHLLALLADMYPYLADIVKADKIGEGYRFNLMCVKNGRIMNLTDTVNDDDTVEIIPPIMGG